MKRNRLITLCLALSMICVRPAMAATRLSDVELADVSGAGSSPPLNTANIPQDQQQPGHSDIFSPVDTTKQKLDGMDPSPAVFSVMQSQAILDQLMRLALSGSAQKRLFALNLENQISSDIIAATNVFGGDFLIPEGIAPALYLSQASRLTQLYRQQGAFDSSSADYHWERTARSRSGSETIDDHHTSYPEQRNRRESFHQQLSSWDVGVEKVASLSDFVPKNEDGKIELVPAWEYPFVDAFTVGGTVKGWFGDEYGAQASYSGLTLHGFEASFDGIESIGDDLVINATVTFPELDLGEIEIKGCAGGCKQKDIDLGSIGGTNLLEILEFSDDVIYPLDGISFTANSIVLEGMAPQLDEELNLNSGFVFAGKGHVELLEPATIDIGGKVSMTLTAHAGFWLDLESIDWFGLLKGAVLESGQDWPYEKDVDFTLIDIEIPFTLVTEQVDPFKLEFDGVVVFQPGPGEISADELETVSVDTHFEDNTRIERSSTEAFAQRSFSETCEHSSFTGGRMTGAEAELLAMSEGTLSVNNGRYIAFSSQAQQGMRVMHGVNAVSSIAANSLNLGQTPVLMGGVGGRPQMSLQQHNQFTQQR